MPVDYKQKYFQLDEYHDKQIEEIKTAFSRYVRTEGCSCCEDIDGHKAAAKELGELLKFPKFDDGEYDFYKQTESE